MRFFAKTDFGRLRQVNQDYYIAENRKIGMFPNLFIVADGVGSNRESSFASKHCSDFIVEQISISKDFIDYKEELEKAYRLANIDLVYRIMANPNYKGMGTTMVTTTIINNKAIIANVGDSRCYHINNNITQITRDHSIAEELVKENAIERNSNKYKELKSQLSRAFGAGKKIETDIFTINLKYGDYILMCSDGLSNMVEDSKILEIIKKDSTLETKVSDLIDEANKNGGKDNITVILIYIDSIIEENDNIINHSSIKEILSKRTVGMVNFKSRSRKRIEGDRNE